MQAELQAERPLWLGPTVAGQPHRTLVIEVLMLPPRGEVATCILVTLGGVLEFIFLGRMDFSPSVC